jgi:hypothetical protein
MKNIRRSRRSRWALGLLPVLIATLLSGTALSPAGADPWVVGDVVVSVSDNQYFSYTSSGTPEHSSLGVDTDPINVGPQQHPLGGLTAGCAFNPTLGDPTTIQNLYATAWHDKKVVVVGQTATTHPILTSIDTTVASAATGGVSPTGNPETIAFDSSGNFFVGLVDGTGPNLLKYNAAHTLIGSWTLPITAGMRGVDSIDLDNDQFTIYWTSEDSTIRTFNTQTGLPGTNFASFAGRRLYNIRLLQPGDAFGTGAVMAVADTSEIKILNAGGAVVNTYGESLPQASELGYGNGYFSISILTTDTTTELVAGDFYGGRAVKFNTADTPVAFYNATRPAFFVNGVCVRGEITRATVPTPDVGYFVVGDIEAGYPFANPVVQNTVNFHDPSWNAIHDPAGPTTLVSGGVPNNNSFKGFSENATITISPCGGSFTSKGGSAGAGALTVGQEIAVIVTNKVTDPAGGSIQGVGDVIAVVKVRITEYSGGGVPVGKGVVIGLICTK